MAIERVREHFEKWGKETEILEFDTSSATVELAANALGVKPERIAKTISFKCDESLAILIVAAGDAKIDNSKFKKMFGFKAKMLTAQEALEITGHAVGGICPFGLINDIPVYLDISLKRFETVFPACGSSNSAIQLTNEELYKYSVSRDWVDVCKGWE